MSVDRDAVLARYPDLDTVVIMSGVMLLEDLRDPAHFEAAETTIDTNLVGTIRVIDAFTPHLVGRGAGTFVTVTSGIAFLPFPPMPGYAASKAAVHAYSEALRAQLDGTSWQGPAADRFRQAWEGEFEPNLAKLRTALQDAATEVARRRDALIQAGS